MEYIKAFFKGFLKGLNPTNWSKKDIAPMIFCFLLGLFHGDIIDFFKSFFN
tara:strand:- start:912 stop:1064 length:153 start_codon:yes stop_codon:yes gene_type:complete